MGYLAATPDLKLQSHFDVRDRKDGLRLELWVDSDHAGLPCRTSTGGWLLTLRGANGTACTLDWASRKQQMVARSSGEAETVALYDAVRRIAGVNRGLCAAAVPVMDTLEQLLGVKLPLSVHVDATVCKAAAKKGASKSRKRR